MNQENQGPAKSGPSATSNLDEQARQDVRLINVKEAAQYLGTTPATLYTKVWRREVPFVKVGRSVRFDVKDIEELIERSKVRPKEFLLTNGDSRRLKS